MQVAAALVLKMSDREELEESLDLSNDEDRPAGDEEEGGITDFSEAPSPVVPNQMASPRSTSTPKSHASASRSSAAADVNNELILQEVKKLASGFQVFSDRLGSVENRLASVENGQKLNSSTDGPGSTPKRKVPSKIRVCEQLA